MSELLRMIGTFVRPHRFRLAVGCAMIAVAGSIFGIMPLFSRHLFDHAIPDRDMRLALYLAGGFLLAQLVRQAFWYTAMRQILLVQERITFALRSQGFGHLQKLCLRFHSAHPSGFLYQRVFGSAIASVGGCMQNVLKQASLYVAAFFISVATCLYLSPPMTAVLVVGCFGYVITSRALSRRIYRKHRESQEAQNQITQFIMDRLRGTKTVQALALEEHVQQDFESRLWPAQVKGYDAIKESWRLSLTSEVLSYILTATVMVVGAYSIFNFDMSVGDLIAFMAYQATLITVVSVITNLSGEIAAARAGMDQLLTVFETQSSVPDVAAPAPGSGRVGPYTGRCELEFRNVSFGYEPASPVVSELNLRVPPGQSVALVGRSGSGKTTLANLLLRFYDPDQGAILLDGRDIRTMPLRQYRQLFGVVLQDPYLFNESIATNLRYAAPGASDEELIEALRKAQAWDFVQKLPGGLEHMAGEAGASLSGGQRARLAIARCMLLRSRFVILDEPTAALDVESERAIARAMESLFQERTVFIIAHRLSTIRKVDRIIVLDNGRIVEDGDYETLAAGDGLFARFHALAMGKEDDRLVLK